VFEHGVVERLLQLASYRVIFLLLLEVELSILLHLEHVAYQFVGEQVDLLGVRLEYSIGWSVFNKFFKFCNLLFAKIISLTPDFYLAVIFAHILVHGSGTQGCVGRRLPCLHGESVAGELVVHRLPRHLPDLWTQQVEPGIGSQFLVRDTLLPVCNHPVVLGEQPFHDLLVVLGCYR